MNPAYKRVYHFHVRKTAGTSLNSAFWALGGLDTQRLSTSPEATGRGLKFARHDLGLIAAGDYFFASSHEPAHRVELPPDTFTVTILRDPVARVVSYYRYLLWAKYDPAAPSVEPFIERVRKQSAILDGGARNYLARFSPRRLRADSRIMGDGPISRLSHRIKTECVIQRPSMRSFLGRIPPHQLYSQLYMFSERMDPAEAARNALACDAVCFTETFTEDFAEIAAALELELEPRHERRFGEKVDLSEGELGVLRERLTPEYEMLESVRESLRMRQSLRR
jgi:hypothetical protein